ncbi:MAG: helix-turn-helix transcriptional regulator [Nitrospinae bacterium]|nr:helix-turn-helix transcriptional regulator [Nitrospinota bacterium]
MRDKWECERACHNPAAAARARRHTGAPGRVARAVEMFKTLADTSRVRIIGALSAGPLCVHDLAQAVGMTQSAVSHQLRTLRQARVVAFTREGKLVHYRLADAHVRDLLSAVFAHAGHGRR